MRTRHLLLVLLAVGSLTALACGPKIDVAKDLTVSDVTTGWFDAGIIKTPEGDKNKLVPTVAFRLKNVSDKAIANVQVMAVYHQVTEKNQEWGTTWVKGVGAEGLQPGQTTQEIVMRNDLGYTGVQPRLQMLQNRYFVDAFATVYVKQGAQKYVKVRDIKIDRQLLTQ